MIIAVDFDDTLFEYSPERRPVEGNTTGIGSPNIELLGAMRLAREAGNKVILWTCREGKALEEAVAMAGGYGLTFDAVNENVKTEQSLRWPDSRKVYADVYIDDKAVRCDWARSLYK